MSRTVPSDEMGRVRKALELGLKNGGRSPRGRARVGLFEPQLNKLPFQSIVLTAQNDRQIPALRVPWAHTSENGQCISTMDQNGTAGAISSFSP